MRREKPRQHPACVRLACVLAVLFLLAFLSGCGSPAKKTLEEGQYYTYYINQAGTALVSVVYEPQAEDTEGILDELLSQCQIVPEGSDGRRAIPANVTLAGPIRLEDNIANIYFDTTYTMMDKVTELLCKAALAKTITQLEEVEYISIYVNDRPYTGNSALSSVTAENGTGPGSGSSGNGSGLTAGESVGNDAANLAISNPEPVLLSGADFIDNTGDATNQYTQAELTLYFANEAGNRLVMENRSVVYSSSMSLERVVLNQLIEGPAAEGNLPTLPSAVKVQGVSLRDGVCYVDFDSIFLNEPMNVTDAIEIYSVVNSLTEITGVSQVQITINGSANEIFRNSIPLSGRFERDESYMEQPEADNEQP